jgi:diguanylate cyclase (GGDEF)-like protein
VISHKDSSASYGPTRVQPGSRALEIVAGRGRLLGLLAGLGALVTLVLVAIELTVSSSARLPGTVTVIAGIGVTLVSTAVLIRCGAGSRVLDAAGAALVLLGIMAGGLLPDGLDAAAVLPLAGAAMMLFSHHGRVLAILFGAALLASLLGETAALTFGMDDAGTLSLPQSLAVSGALLGLVYSLIWWVGEQWWASAARAEHALDSQRRLLEINERLLSSLDPEGVLDLIADSLKPLVQYDGLSIYRVDWKASAIRPVLARDGFADVILGATFPIGTGLTGWVLKHGEAQLVNDTITDPRSAQIPGTPEEPEALIVAPLFVRGEVAGTLNVGRMGGPEVYFSPSEFDLVRLFAGQASIALQNAETHRAAWDRAKTDSLTGLQNRGEFEERLKDLAGRPEMHPFALIMLDLDDFKRYNDGKGHPAGDTILQVVGRAICSAVRDRDLAFRYGGDEFAILIPNADLSVALPVAERVIAAIAEYVATEEARITASAGVACLPGGALTAAGLVATADAALYKAKKLGGARVAIGGKAPLVPVVDLPTPPVAKAS